MREKNQTKVSKKTVIQMGKSEQEIEKHSVSMYNQGEQSARNTLQPTITVET